jgi:hypothetical protein
MNAVFEDSRFQAFLDEYVERKTRPQFEAMQHEINELRNLIQLQKEKVSSECNKYTADVQYNNDVT